MTSTNALPQTKTRPRRTVLGMVFASVVLGSTLTACGSSPGDTTCGELKDMSSDERIDLLDEAAEDEDSEEADAYLDASDDEKKAFADALPAVCDGEDDDTKLDDIEGF